MDNISWTEVIFLMITKYLSSIERPYGFVIIMNVVLTNTILMNAVLLNMILINALL